MQIRSFTFNIKTNVKEKPVKHVSSLLIGTPEQKIL